MLIQTKPIKNRLSATRDHAWQLTLKSFASEGIDWQRAFVSETVDVMAKLIGRERMTALLEEMLCLIKKEDSWQLALDLKGK